MAGALISVFLLWVSGVTQLTLGAIVLTTTLTTVSVVLFGPNRRGRDH